MELLTMQGFGVDPTRDMLPPHPHYVNPRGDYYDLSQFLGWKKWVWCVTRMQDFTDQDRMTNHALRILWVLDVPEDKIRWCSLEAEHRRKTAEECFFPTAEAIRARGETPVGFVECPVNHDWFISSWIIELHKLKFRPIYKCGKDSPYPRWKKMAEAAKAGE